MEKGILPLFFLNINIYTHKTIVSSSATVTSSDTKERAYQPLLILTHVWCRRHLAVVINTRRLQTGLRIFPVDRTEQYRNGWFF